MDPQNHNALQKQVFISHTGQDEQGRIFAASVLKPALDAAGITTFIDFNNLNPGCLWQPELVEAAATSAVFVVVLTQTFGKRFWCLRELDIALHGHPCYPRSGEASMIIPVYIDHHSNIHQLSTEEVKQQLQKHIDELALAADQSSVAERAELQLLLQDPERLLRNLKALSDHQGVRRQHHTPQQQQQQQPPLPQQQQQQQQQVAAACSRSVPPPKDEEWQLARRVVATALRQLPPQAYLPPDLEGYKAHSPQAEQFAELLAELAVAEPDVRGLWLYGPGGLGKTTMATMLDNKLRSSFPKAAMMELSLKGSTPEQLQRQLEIALKKLGLSTDGSQSELLQRFADFVKREKVLLLIDNVNHDSQLDGLLPTVFSGGSRIIITSRVRNLPSSRVYQALHTRAHLLHVMPESLSAASAEALFRKYHGLSEHALDVLGLCQLEAALLQACGGLPLALQVIGGALNDGVSEVDHPMAVGATTEHQTTFQLWKEVHTSFVQRGLNDPQSPSEVRLQSTVTLTFNNLSEVARNIFLDCVSVMRHESSKRALPIWEALWADQGGVVSSFKELQRRALISVDDFDVLMIHDVILSLGRGILSNRHSPFYSSRLWTGDDWELVVKFDREAQERVVAVDLSGVASPLHSDCISKLGLSQLRMLMNGGYWVYTSPQFWSDSTSRQSDEVAPATLLQSLYESLWFGQHKPILSLPPAFAQMTALVVLDLRGAEFRSLPQSFGQLTALQWLDLSECQQLQSLPHSFGQLTALQWLDLRSCQQLQSLPQSFGQLTALQWLDLGGCQQLQSLPQSFGQLAALRRLNLSDCRLLSSLPESFGGLTALQKLFLSFCGQLSSLPESFGGLTMLQTIDLTYCKQLSCLPESIGGLTALQELNLCWCGQLSYLPESFGQLSALQKLVLSFCGQLSSLPESLGGLTTLQKLELKSCMQLSYLPKSIGQLQSLQQLDFSNCRRLSSLPESFGQLPALQKLNLSYCEQLESLPNSFGQLKGLHTLNLNHCRQLASLPESFQQLKALRHLNLGNCDQLVVAPQSFEGLTGLVLLNTRHSDGVSLPPILLQLAAEECRLKCYDYAYGRSRGQIAGHAPHALISAIDS